MNNPEPSDTRVPLPKKLTHYYETLYNDALRYLEQGQTSMAIIVAQTAVELCTESTLEELLRIYGVDVIRKSLAGVFKSYAITNDRLRGLFNALSNDDVEQSEFWHNLKALSKVRNAIVHNGDNCQQDEAKRLIPAVGKYIEYTCMVTEQRMYDFDPPDC
jgi:HEPN domain-containing protein